jgi:acyl transferase domain-containing protein
MHDSPLILSTDSCTNINFQNQQVNMLDLTENRWKGVGYDLPKYSAFMPNIEKFDGQFFGIPNKRVDAIDPQSRILLEHAYEAIFDAGVFINHNEIWVPCVSGLWQK